MYFRTCVRLENLVQDKSLWTVIDARQSPNSLKKGAYCLRNVNDRTKRLYLAADNKAKLVFSLVFPIGHDSLCDLSKLSVLALENQFIDGYNVIDIEKDKII